MAAIVGALIAAGGSLYASNQAKKGAEGYQAQLRQDRGTGIAYIDEFLAQLDHEFAKVEQLYREQLNITQGAAVAEQALISQQGEAARRQILERETQRQGEMRAGMARRGLGSSTVQDTYARGIASDTDRQLLGLSEGLTQQRAESLRYNTAAQGSALTGLANVFQAKAGARQGYHSNLLQMLGGTQVTFDASPYAAQANAFGQIGGALMQYGMQGQKKDTTQDGAGG